MSSGPGKRVLTDRDVLRLLRTAIRKCGGQSEWARSCGVARTVVNKTLSGRRRPSPQITQALGLKTVVGGVSALELQNLLKQAIAAAGGISEFSRRTGIDRTYVSVVIHGKKPASARIFRALNIEPKTLYVDREGAPPGKAGPAPATRAKKTQDPNPPLRSRTTGLPQ